MDAIPVANIYFLLCYAWDQFAPDALNRIADEQASDIFELFARLLVKGVFTLRRRGFETGYRELEEITSTVRGRILIAPSLKLKSRMPSRLVCTHDDLTSNVLRNRILKSTLLRIPDGELRDRKIEREMTEALVCLRAFDTVRLSNRVFYEVQSRHGDQSYAFLMNICLFLFESLQPSETTGALRFKDVLREPERMRRVFEKFVRNFLRTRQKTYECKSERLGWSETSFGQSDPKFLPSMLTDITLRSPQNTVVIECKYTESLLHAGRFEAQKVRSEHLYQLCTYLHALEPNGGTDARAEGILLYPVGGTIFDQAFRLQGHIVRIKTLNLGQHWSEIERDLLAILPTSELQ